MANTDPATVDDRSLAYALRRVRVARAISQQQIADRLELHRPAVTEIEAGRRKLSAVELYRWAEVCRVKPAAIYRLALAAELALAFARMITPEQTALDFEDVVDVSEDA